MTRKQLPLLALGFSSLIVLLANLGNPLAGGHSDEPLYIGIAREMMRLREWVLPYYHGQPAFYKPPLLYWMMILSFKIFGSSSLFAARFPAAICGAALAVTTALLGIRLIGKRAGLLAGWLTLTTIPGMYAFARAGLMDIPFTLFLTLSFYWAMEAFRKESPLRLAAFFVSAGLAALFKGPVTIVILTVPLAWLFLSERKGKLFFQPPALAGWFAFLALLLFWPAAAFAQGKGGVWWHFFILQENLGKFSSSLDPTTHPTPGSVVWIHLFSQFMPWGFFLLASFLLLITQRRKPNFSSTFLLLWILTVVAVFLLPEKKLSHYTLPALPACALLAASVILSEANSILANLSFLATGLIFGIAGLLLLLLARIVEIPMFPISAAAAFGTAAIFLFRKQWQPAAAAAAAFLFLFALGLPNMMSSLSLRDLQAQIGNRPVASYRLDFSMIGTALQKEIPTLSSADEVKKMKLRGFLILPESDQADFQEEHVALSPPLLVWRSWKDHIRLLDILQAAISGDKTLIRGKILLTAIH